MSIKPGALRFNTDSMKLEIFRGSANYNGTASMAGIGTLAAGQWEEIQATSPEVQTGGTRGVIVCGRDQTGIDYVNMDSTGNAISFGTASDDYEGFALASRTRGVFGGTLPGYSVTMKHITISSTGNDTTFGDMTVARRSMGSCANSTRGVLMGGLDNTSPSYAGSNVIDYITIASTGDAVNFGDLYSGAGNHTGSPGGRGEVYTGNGGNGSDGCAFTSGDRILTGTALSSSYTLTLGDQNMTDADSNVVLVRIGLASGESVTALSVS